MQRLAWTAGTIGAALSMATSAAAAPGDLDPTFGTGGTVTVTAGSRPAAVSFSAADTVIGDGFFVAGTAGGGDFGLVMLGLDGSTPSFFEGGGAAIADFGGNDQAAAVATTPTADEFAVAGNTDAGGTNQAAIAVFDGTGLDETFSGDGRATVPLPSAAVVTDVTIDPVSGRVGVSFDTPDVDAGSSNLEAFVLTPGGALDTAYGPADSGFVSANSGAIDSALTAEFDSSGRLVLGGRAGTGTAANFAFGRFDPDGETDTSFDFDGFAAVDIASAGRADSVSALAIDSSGRVVATGPSGSSGATVRLTTGGALDTTFDGGGLGGPGYIWFFETPGGPFNNVPEDVDIGGGGRVAVWGTYTEAASVGRLQILDSSGALVQAEPSTGEVPSFVYDLPSPRGVGFVGSFLAVSGIGNDPAAGGAPGSFAQLWETTGGSYSPRPSFGGDGTVFLQPTKRVPADASVSASAPAGAGAPAGSYYVTGSVATSDDARGLFVSRHLGSGALDPSFDADGVAVAPIGTSGEDVFPGGIAVQPDGKPVIVGGTLSGGDYSSVAARFTTGGSLDAGFDGPGAPGDGMFEFDLGSGNSGLRAVAADASRLVVAGYNNDNDAAIAQLTATGAFDPNFGAGGQWVTDLIGLGGALGVALPSDGQHVVFAASSTGEPGQTKIARITDDPLTNGDTAFDSSFSGDGTMNVNGLSVPNDGYDPIALDASGNVLVAGFNAGSASVARVTSAGEPDPAFSGDGSLLFEFAAGSNLARSIRPLPGGGAVVAGYVSGADDFGLAQLTPAGELESGFGGDGTTTTDFGTPASAAGFGPVSASHATVAGSAGPGIAGARYELFVPAVPGGGDGGGGGGGQQVTPQTPVQPTPPPAVKCKKPKKKKKRSASAAAKCKKKKKKKKK